VEERKEYGAFGEMLFTHFGLSGPIILSLSRLVVSELNSQKKVTVSIDLKPALDEQKLDNRLLRDLDTYGKKNLENLFKSWLPGKMVPLFLEILEIDGKKPAHQMTAKERRRTLHLLKNFALEVTGYRGFKEAIITAGGISTKEIDNKSLQSKLIRGLYFAGEIIDLDANTGGYNLQIAFSSGWFASESCMRDHRQNH
jgi:predicted Rossmann fold flavoprotein